MAKMFMPKVPAPAPAPAPQAPATMPDAEAPEVLEAKRNDMFKALKRGGRSSTILTGEGDRGGAYNGTTLG
jgi:hypothetical protein